MSLDAVWQQFAYIVQQLWDWIRYQTYDHPFLALGMLAVAIFAWRLYKMEVRAR